MRFYEVVFTGRVEYETKDGKKHVWQKGEEEFLPKEAVVELGINRKLIKLRENLSAKELGLLLKDVRLVR
jgi:hypothetical protein